MKDYSIGENKKNYILYIDEKKENGTFDVIFADGSKFCDVEANDANLEKIIQIQERQAKEGIANKAVFVGRRTKAGVLTVLNAGALAVGVSAITNIPVINNLLATQDPRVVAAGIGTITILGTIPAVAKLFRENEKVAELEKLEYLSKHRRQLETYKQYHNVLKGINKGAALHFRKSSEPFCILDIDEYDKKDLEQMIENMEKEDSFAFTYKKKKTSSNK